MKIPVYPILGALALIVSSCDRDKQVSQVISQKYVHKYGYAVSKDEWEERSYPGQVITTLRNGVTVTATYESGMLHGPTTYTYPDSQVVHTYHLFNQGTQVKEIIYDPLGMPLEEKAQISPTRYTLTTWYHGGSPKSIEDYASEELIEGQYFNEKNEPESKVEKGNGLRIRRDQKGLLLAKEEIEEGYVSRQENFFPSGAPESIVHYYRTKLQGEFRTFAPTGEPVAIEEWIDGKRHGKSTYFKNGVKTHEISYLFGLKNGLETHYVDGERISQQVCWEADKKHGAARFFTDDDEKTEWYYAGELVSKNYYDELSKMDGMISQLNPASAKKNSR